MNSHNVWAEKGLISEIEVERRVNDLVKLSASDGITRHLEITRGSEVVRIYNTKCYDGKWYADLDYVLPPHGLINRS